MMGFWFFIPLFLQNVYEYTPLEAGLAFLLMTIANFVVAMAVPLLRNDMEMDACSLQVWLSRISADVAYLTGIAFPMIVIGDRSGGNTRSAHGIWYCRFDKRRRRCSIWCGQCCTSAWRFSRTKYSCYHIRRCVVCSIRCPQSPCRMGSSFVLCRHLILALAFILSIILVVRIPTSVPNPDM
jgi:hypothetical protein